MARQNINSTVADKADESHRFVLPPNAPLAENLAALWAAEPRLAEAIEAMGEEAGYPLERARSGESTVSVRTADGRTVYMHSRHQPLDEATRLISTASTSDTATFYVMGLGLGYHLEQLFERASDEAIFCVFEPDLRMIRTALSARDYSEVIGSGRVMFFFKPDKANIFGRLTPHTALISLGVQMVSHAPSLQLHDAFFRQMETWLGEFAAFCKTNMNTLVLNSQVTAVNISRNLGWYVATPGIGRLKNRHAKQPGVIISAGPSLRKNKHLLKGLEKNAVLIAVQTTLQPMLEIGVEPHYVTSLDYHEICTRFFEKLPKKIRTELIADPKATSGIFELMTGPVTTVGCEFAESVLRELQLDKTMLTSGATVAHLAFYLAEHLGCDPIIFVGQDLGFSDGLCYSPGTSYEDVWKPELSRFCTLEMKQWEQIVRERPILRKIPDFQGRPMYTEERLFAYLHQFERDFAKSPARIIDATEGGAMKRGTRVMTLAEAIEEFCRNPLPLMSDERPAMRWDLLESARSSVLLRQDEALQIEQICRKTLPLLEEIRDSLSDQRRVNRAIGQVDELRAKIDSLGRTYELVMQFTQQSELRRFEKDRKIAASGAGGTNKQQRQVERDIENVEAVIVAAEEFGKLMEDVADRLARRAIKEAA